MSWSFPIGHLFGSEVRVHATFFLLIAWIGVSGWIDGGAAGAGLNVLYVLILFACVIAHEFGHALMARRFGIRTPDVTLLPIGGLARLERMPEKPGREVLVALAGPAVNVAIFLALLVVIGPSAIANARFDTISLASLPAQIALLNLVLAAFNMIPAFPMDGGRVLRASLSAVMDRAAATRVAALAGQGLAVAMGVYGFTSGNPVLLLIAVFIFISARSESTGEAMRGMARRLRARDAMITAFEALDPEDGLDTAAAALIRTTQHEFPVVDPASGQCVGLLTRPALLQALDQTPRPARVGDVMRRDLPTATLAEGLGSVLAKMQTGTPAVAVLSGSKQMIGYITPETLGELMAVMRARRA